MTLPPLPDHAYVPRRNARHPEGAFDAIRAAAAARTTSEGAAENRAWRYGLLLLRESFFWEAHEVLEPVWMNAAPNAPERHVCQSVIQLANAALKMEMGRPRAAKKLCEHADELAREAGRSGPVVMEIPIQRLRDEIAALRDEAIWGKGPAKIRL